MEREVLEQIIATSSSQHEDGLRVKIGETLESVDSQNLTPFFSGTQICLKITCSLSHPAPPSTWPGSLATHQKAAATWRWWPAWLQEGWWWPCGRYCHHTWRDCTLWRGPPTSPMRRPSYNLVFSPWAPWALWCEDHDGFELVNIWREFAKRKGLWIAPKGHRELTDMLLSQFKISAAIKPINKTIYQLITIIFL